MKSRGFTLIELAVVLAIIAVLAAVLTPMVTGYIDQARVARAMGDTRSIADAARLYQRDVGEFPIWNNTTEYAAGAGTPSVGIGGTNGTAASNAGTYFSSVGTSSLESYVNANALGRSTNAAIGRVAFRGPYLGNLDADPWGNKYYITGANLKTGSANWGFVISAGPNGSLDATLNQAKSGAFSAGGTDDIVVVIR